MKLILEKAKSICPNCKMEIKEGEMITWTQAGGNEQHVVCAGVVEQQTILCDERVTFTTWGNWSTP